MSRREVFLELERLLHMIGSANDAEDHDYTGEAERMRRDSCDAIRALLAAHPFPGEALPDLPREMETERILWWGWSALLDRIDELLRD